MSQTYAIIFALILCLMCFGHGITAKRWGFAIFFAAMTTYNAIALVGAAK